MGVYIWEREWESLTATEATYETFTANPDSSDTLRKLSIKTGTIIESFKCELL